MDNKHNDAIALGAESEADSSFMITKDDKSDAKEKTWISEEFAKQFEDANSAVCYLSVKKIQNTDKS